MATKDGSRTRWQPLMTHVATSHKGRELRDCGGGNAGRPVLSEFSGTGLGRRSGRLPDRAAADPAQQGHWTGGDWVFVIAGAAFTIFWL